MSFQLDEVEAKTVAFLKAWLEERGLLSRGVLTFIAPFVLQGSG